MRQILIPFLTAAIVIGAMIYQAMTPEPRLMEAPKIVLADIPGYRGEDLPPGEAELTTLPKDTQIIKKRYYDTITGDWFVVNVVIGGTSKGSIHRPELCLPSQGFQMVRPRTWEVSGRDWHVLDIERGYGAPLGFAYTFFNQEGFATSSHIRRIFRDVIDRSLLNRYDRWVMVTLNAGRADERLMRGFLEKLEPLLKHE